MNQSLFVWRVVRAITLSARILGSMPGHRISDWHQPVFGAIVVRNPDHKRFVLFAQRDKMGEFESYMASQQIKVIAWIDEGFLFSK